MRTRQHTCRTPYPSAHVEQVVPHRFRKWVVVGKLWTPFIQFSFMRYRTECVFMGFIVPGHDAPGGRRTAAKGIACRYLYKKANITLMEVHSKELANHVLLDLAREASIALMEVRPAC